MRNRRLVALLGCMALVPLAALAADAPPGKPDHRGEHWAALDTNGDGAVSKDEAAAGAPRMAEHFAEIDTSGDGLITKDEMQAARGKHHQEMQARGEERFKGADKNGDGVIDLAEAQQGMPRAAEHFKALDTDGNGNLTREELKAGMHAHRGEGQWGGQQKPVAPE